MADVERESNNSGQIQLTKTPEKGSEAEETEEEKEFNFLLF